MAGERHRARVANDLSLTVESIEDARDQAVIGQVRELRREMHPRDRRLARTGRVQPAQGPKHAVLQIGRELDQYADAASWTERELRQGARFHERRQPDFYLADSEAGQGGEASLGPGREAEESQGRAKAVYSVLRLQAFETLDDRTIAASVSARDGLNDPAAAERRRRALRSQDKRLAVDRDERMGHEELGEPRHVRPGFDGLQQ